MGGCLKQACKIWQFYAHSFCQIWVSRAGNTPSPPRTPHRPGCVLLRVARPRLGWQNRRGLRMLISLIPNTCVTTEAIRELRMEHDNRVRITFNEGGFEYYTLGKDS